MSKLCSPGQSIFVFGSNLAGRHGLGAALHAALAHRAQRGVGEGPTGTAYALPTKGEDLRTRPLGDIALSVARFTAYARAHPHDAFWVTRVGCGLAGYTDEQMAPLFAEAAWLDNCSWPEEWLRPGAPLLTNAREADAMPWLPGQCCTPAPAGTEGAQ